MNINNYKWVYSEGGPLIAIEEEQREKWLGCFSLSEYNNKKELIFEEDFLNPEKTHYGKACGVSTPIPVYLDVIHIDQFSVLVLSDEPATTTFIELINGEVGIFCRWIYGDEDDIEIELDKLNNLNWQEEDVSFTISSSNLVLFDAAQIWNQVKKDNNFLKINISKGSYKLSTAEYKPDDKTFFLLHKIEKI